MSHQRYLKHSNYSGPLDQWFGEQNQKIRIVLHTKHGSSIAYRQINSFVYRTMSHQYSTCPIKEYIDVQYTLISLTLPCWRPGFPAPNNNSAVTLLNAAKPSMGRYCTIKWRFHDPHQTHFVRSTTSQKTMSSNAPLYLLVFSFFQHKFFCLENKKIIINHTFKTKINTINH